MTTEQLEYKRLVEDAKSRSDGSHKELQRQCKHFVEPSENRSTGMVSCAICGYSLRWYCADSPDRTCHYRSKAGLIDLVDGSRTPVPMGHNPDDESREWCIFCSQPYERK